MRKVVPGVICVQRGSAVKLPPGIARIPIHPKGWVTVRAKFVGGPTFAEEVNLPRAVEGTASLGESVVLSAYTKDG